MINPLVLYGAGAALLVGFGAGWSVRDWKADSDAVAAFEKAEKIRNKLQIKYDGLALGYETDRSTSEANSIIRQTELRTIYRDVPIDGDCAAPDSARSLLQNSLDETNARISGEPTRPMSENTPTSQSPD